MSNYRMNEFLGRYKREMMLAIAALLLIPVYYWVFGEPLFFRQDGDRQIASFERKGRVYWLARSEDTGSGNYVHYSLFTFDGDQQRLIQEVTTCGRFKLEADRILFVKPVEFHCGLLTAPLNELAGKAPIQVIRF